MLMWNSSNQCLKVSMAGTYSLSEPIVDPNQSEVGHNNGVQYNTLTHQQKKVNTHKVHMSK